MDRETIIKKLKIDKASNLLIVNAPKDYIESLAGVSFDKESVKDKEGKYDFVQIFATEQIILEQLTLSVKDAGKKDCYFWACYPKGGGKIKSDIKRDTVWKAFELAGLQAVAQVAIDETWSALRARPKDMIGK